MDFLAKSSVMTGDPSLPSLQQQGMTGTQIWLRLGVSPMTLTHRDTCFDARRLFFWKMA